RGIPSPPLRRDCGPAACPPGVVGAGRFGANDGAPRARLESHRHPENQQAGLAWPKETAVKMAGQADSTSPEDPSNLRRSRCASYAQRWAEVMFAKSGLPFGSFGQLPLFEI